MQFTGIIIVSILQLTSTLLKTSALSSKGIVLSIVSLDKWQLVTNTLWPLYIAPFSFQKHSGFSVILFSGLLANIKESLSLKKSYFLGMELNTLEKYLPYIYILVKSICLNMYYANIYNAPIIHQKLCYAHRKKWAPPNLS